MGSDLLFISDIRTADHKIMTKLENEQTIIKDNDAQMRWVNIMLPQKSMLKFRCPYPDVISENMKMFDGELMIQPWAPQSSTETRLIPKDSLKIIEYDSLDYEEKMFHHNDITRKNRKYSQPIELDGLDNQYDSSAEVVILYRYLKTWGKSLDENCDWQERVRNLSESFNSIGNRGLNVLTKPKHERRNYPSVDHEKNRIEMKKVHKEDSKE